MPTIKNANTLPQNALNKSVKFSTTNLDNGQPFIEPYILTGPSGSFNLPLNSVTNGNTKVMVPLTTNTADGASYLKIHIPTVNTDIMYVTFAIKSSTMKDGYYDYITGIPAAYRADLRTWILDGTTSVPFVPTTFSKTLVFSVYGKDTNQTAQAIQFRVKFNAIFGNSPTQQTSTF